MDTVKKQLSKVDNYPFQITQINVNYDGTLFIQKKGNVAIATTWMDLADIKLTEVSQTGKDEILYYFTYI